MKHKDKLPGGKADKKKPSDFDKKALTQGIKVELEHTKDKKLAMEIAMDHLTEDPKYYEKLKTIHTEKSVPKTSKEVGCGEGLSGKICRENNKKLNKSYYQFDNAKVRVDSTQHDLAEQTASPELVDYLNTAVEAELSKIRLPKGLLTLYNKDRGLYSGFFQDNEGQIVHKFDDMTVPMVAKALSVSKLYDVKNNKESERVVMTQPDKDMPAKYVKIKYGDFELEIKKSLNGFIKDFQRNKNKRVAVMKAIQSWRRNSVAGQIHKSDLSAAQDLLDRWDQFQEEFYQILEVMKKNHE